MLETSQFVPPKEVLLSKIKESVWENGFEYQSNIASIKKINTITNFEPFQPGRTYSIQLVGLPGAGKTKYLDHLYGSGFENLTCAPEPFGTARKYSNMTSEGDKFHHYLYAAYSNFQDIQILNALMAKLPLYDFPLARRFEADDFIGQATTAGFFKFIAEKELNEDGFSYGVVITDRSAYDLAVIWPQVTYLIGSLSHREYKLIVEARNQMRPVNERCDATFIMLANISDCLERKNREDDPENTYMNLESLSILTTVYLYHFQKLVNEGCQNVSLIDASKPEDKVNELMDHFFNKIASNVVNKRELIR